MNDAARIATQLIRNAGFTPDLGAILVDSDGGAHAFSVESAEGFSMSGPAAWSYVTGDGAASLNNRSIRRPRLASCA